MSQMPQVKLNVGDIAIPRRGARYYDCATGTYYNARGDVSCRIMEINAPGSPPGHVIAEVADRTNGDRFLFLASDLVFYRKQNGEAWKTWEPELPPERVIVAGDVVRCRLPDYTTECGDHIKQGQKADVINVFYADGTNPKIRKLRIDTAPYGGHWRYVVDAMAFEKVKEESKKVAAYGLPMASVDVAALRERAKAEGATLPLALESTEPINDWSTAFDETWDDHRPRNRKL